MREKGKKKKEQKILIRVNRDEKKLAEEMARNEGKNTSQFLRDLIHDHKEIKLFDMHLGIIDRYEKTLEKFRQILSENNKNTG